jgi:thioredoxin reductase
VHYRVAWSFRLNRGRPLAAGRAVYDVVIAGGGAAGLSAALMLGRCRRQVLLCDTGTPRNAASRGLHGYLTRDGIDPLEFLRIGRDELREYGIAARKATVTEITTVEHGFAVELDGGERVESRKVLIASGVRDHVPDLPGVRDCYGVSVHHCPYCDGWEVRDRRLVVLGQGAAAAGLALSLKTWSAQVTIVSNGRPRISTPQRAQLSREQIEIDTRSVSHLAHESGRARSVRFSDGGSRDCDALFFTAGQSLQCELPRQLGCEFTRKGTVKTDHLGQTCVPGVYVVGDASYDVQFVVVAAAEGAKAAVAINKALQAQSGLVLD